MQRGLIWVVFLFSVLIARAAPLPLTAKEVSLMLRTGYSASTVAQELSVRRFADTLDSTEETMLIQAGASPALIHSLKDGTYSVPPEQVAKTKEQFEEQAKRRAFEEEQSRKFNTLYQAQVARERSNRAAQPAASNAIYASLKGDLVHRNNGVVTRFDDAALEKKKIFLLYFSAQWCGPCRKFTPQLVDYYNRVVPQHPELELIFVSRDKSSFAMETYMRDMKMPWPAVDYQKVAAKEGITKYAGEGIPDLVLVDLTGKVISTSYEGKKYVGPGKVITDLETIFAAVAKGPVAASR